MSGGPNIAGGAKEGHGIGHSRRTAKQKPRSERDAARRQRQLARQMADDKLRDKNG